MDLIEIASMSESEARSYLETIRWLNGPVCPHCESQTVTRLQGDAARDGVIQCNACREQFTVTVGSVMESTHIPLVKWVMAFHLMTSSKKGISALQLQRNLKLGSYRTAWLMSKDIKNAIEKSIEYRIIEGAIAYRVGSDGSIWSRWTLGKGCSPTGEWKLMHPTPDREGYGRVQLRISKEEALTRKVCSLILAAFKGPRPEGKECRHLDGNNSNNSIENLEWGTPLENHADKREHGTIAHGIKHGSCKFPDEKVAAIRAMKGLAIQNDVAIQFGVSRTYVGRLWKSMELRNPDRSYESNKPKSPTQIDITTASIRCLFLIDRK